jgi:hypothetical protein
VIILGHACRPVRNVQDQSWFCYVDAVQIHAYQSGQRWFVRVELSGDADVTVAGNAITLSAAEDKVRIALMRYVPDVARWPTWCATGSWRGRMVRNDRSRPHVPPGAERRG